MSNTHTPALTTRTQWDPRETEGADRGQRNSFVFLEEPGESSVPDRDQNVPRDRPTRDVDDILDYELWREERGRRGRKRRDKAGGRREKNRQRHLS